MILCALLLVLPVWWWHGAPFVPTDPAKVNRLVRLAQVKAGDKVCDLGSGDGRLVMACARAGASVVGLELNPFLVWLSRWHIRQAGLEDRASVRQANLWQEDLSGFNVVLVFGAGGPMMSRLESKLMGELQPGARVVSNGFAFPNWQPANRDRSLYFYVRT